LSVDISTSTPETLNDDDFDGLQFD